MLKIKNTTRNFLLIDSDVKFEINSNLPPATDFFMHLRPSEVLVIYADRDVSVEFLDDGLRLRGIHA